MKAMVWRGSYSWLLEGEGRETVLEIVGEDLRKVNMVSRDAAMVARSRKLTTALRVSSLFSSLAEGFLPLAGGLLPLCDMVGAVIGSRISNGRCVGWRREVWVSVLYS